MSLSPPRSGAQVEPGASVLAGPPEAVAPAPAPRRPRWLDVACIGGIALSVILSYAVLPATPALLGSHPEVLELLTGSTTATVAAGAFARVGRLLLVVVLLAPLLQALVFDPFYWWAGRRYGDQVVLRFVGPSPRARRAAARTERFVARWGAWALLTEYYLPLPASLIRVVAGTSGMSLPRFLFADMVGALLWYVPAALLGYAIGAPAVRVVHAVSHDSLLIGVVLVVAVVGIGLARGLVGRRR